MTSQHPALAAARHLDPAQGVMRAGHVVDETDIAALRQVLDVAASVLDPAPASVSSQCQMGYHDQCAAQLRATGQSCGCPRHADAGQLCAGDIRRVEVRGGAGHRAGPATQIR